jgi:hypothetical protein
MFAYQMRLETAIEEVEGVDARATIRSLINMATKADRVKTGVHIVAIH